MTEDPRHKTQDTSGNHPEERSNEGSLADARDGNVAEEYLQGWKRALADYENLQKQNAQLRDDDRRRIRINLAHEFLPVIDNFEQAMKFAPKEVPKDVATWFTGVQHISRQFADALKSLGIEPIDAIGKPFDPHLHESGGSRWEEDKEEHVVLEEIIKGWRLGDLVIRPSKVIVNQRN